MEKNETEVVVYSKINDFEGLKEADAVEEHQQLEYTLSTGNRSRVRRCAFNGNVVYTFTVKEPISEKEGLESNTEHNIIVDQKFYDAFRTIATKLVIKTRYIFHSKHIDVSLNTEDDERNEIVAPLITYEVDVYKDKEGKIVEWCKIDVEIDELLKYLEVKHPDEEQYHLNIKVSHLPFKPSDSILTLTSDVNQKQFINKLWEEHYNLSPN